MTQYHAVEAATIRCVTLPRRRMEDSACSLVTTFRVSRVRGSRGTLRTEKANRHHQHQHHSSQFTKLTNFAWNNSSLLIHHQSSRFISSVFSSLVIITLRGNPASARVHLFRLFTPVRNHSTSRRQWSTVNGQAHQNNQSIGTAP
jgi:hypothetical protein